MIIHFIPYEFLEKVFGTAFADNFNLINLILGLIGFVIAVMLGRRFTFKIRSRPVEYQDQEEEEPEGEPVYESRKGEWSPTGWFYDNEKKEWIPPDYSAEESRLKWRWDDDKKIWIDIEKEERMKRYLKNRRAMGKEPTYEEWKAAKLAAEKNDA